MTHNHEKFEAYWVESLKNPPNTIHFPKDRPTKFLCGVCDDKQEKNGDCRYVLEQHSLTKTHQRNLKAYKKEKLGHIVLSSDDDEEEQQQEKRRVGRPRRSRSDEDDDKKKKKTTKDDEDEEEEEEEHDEDESDSDRPSRKRERAKDIDLAYRPTAAARVANSVATLPMTRRESSVTPAAAPASAAPPARAGPPLAQSLFAQRFSNIIDKVMMSDIATDACREEFYALLKTDGVQNQVRTHLKRALKEQAPSVVMQVLREIIEEEEKERLQAFLKSDKAADMRADAYARHLDGPQTQAFFAEGTQGFFNE